MNSDQYKVYKSKGAAQFQVLPPRRDERGYIEKSGAILLEAAPGDGNKQNPKWDWSKEKKISFAIGIPDIAKLLETDGVGKLVHDNEGSIKSLQFREGQDQFAGTYMLSLAEGEKKIMVPFTGGEFQLLMKLIIATAPFLLDWPNCSK